MKATLVAVMIMLCAGAASADTTYDYTVQPFSTFGGITCPPECSMTGSFSVAQPLPPNLAFGAITPTTFSFTDGSVTITPLNYGHGNSFFKFSTDASGAIAFWNVTLTEVWPPNLVTEYAPNPQPWGPSIISFDGVYTGGYAFTSTAGTWTQVEPIATPEPGTALLLGAGLLFAAIRRKALRA